MTQKFQNKYRIPSARATWHDYNGGNYFITVCTKNMICRFGHVSDGKMHLNALGEFIADSLQNISIHYPYCEIPVFVVMPNHWHAIVCIHQHNVVETRLIASLQQQQREPKQPQQKNGGITGLSNPMITQNLSAIIRHLKGKTTYFARQQNIPFNWQARFHDHIIRTHIEFNNIAKYIENNPVKWKLNSRQSNNKIV